MNYIHKSLFLSLFCCMSLVSIAQPIFDITDFGAVGDGKTHCTAQIQTAINNCSKVGGVVLVPTGVFMTGMLKLKDNVELRVAAGATLLGSDKQDDYPEVMLPYFTTKNSTGMKALIFAEEAKNIAITGRGTIDGNGGAKEFECYPILDDPKGAWHKPMRPAGIRFVKCEQVLIEGVKLRSAATWMMHLLACKGIRITGIDLFNHANANNDGIDIDGCEDVRISDAVVDTDDDAIVLKTKCREATKFVTVTNCVLASKTNAFKLGTESRGDFENITLSNCVFRESKEEHPYDPNRTQIAGTGIAIEMVDGGKLNGVTVSNVVMEGYNSPIFIRLGNRGRSYHIEEEDVPVGTLENVLIQNVLAKRSRDNCSSITGIPGHAVKNVMLSNIRIEVKGGLKDGFYVKDVPEKEDSYPYPGMFGKNLPAAGFFIRHVQNIRFHQVNVHYINSDSRPAFIFDDVWNAKMRDVDSNAHKLFIMQNMQHKELEVK